MKRLICGAALALGLAGALGQAGAAPPAPTFTATLTHDSTCLFTMTATWNHTKIDHVFGNWYEDDPTLSSSWATTEAPGTGPNGGTLMGKTAVMQAGPLNTTAETHTHQVRVQFYYRGAQIQEVFTNVDTANCSI
jgi:hypothetical protein